MTILLPESQEIRLHQLAIGMRHELDLHAASALREHVQRSDTRIRVDDNQRPFCATDEPNQQGLRIPEASLIEDLRCRHASFAHPREDLIEASFVVRLVGNPAAFICI